MDRGVRLDCGGLLPCGHHEEIVNTFSLLHFGFDSGLRLLIKRCSLF